MVPAPSVMRKHMCMSWHARSQPTLKKLTRAYLRSVCKDAKSHYPLCTWLGLMLCWMIKRRANRKYTVIKWYATSATFVPAMTLKYLLYSPIHCILQGWIPFDNVNMIDPTQSIVWHQILSTVSQFFFSLFHLEHYWQDAIEISWTLLNSNLSQNVDLNSIDDSAWWGRMANNRMLHQCNRTCSRGDSAIEQWEHRFTRGQKCSLGEFQGCNFRVSAGHLTTLRCLRLKQGRFQNSWTLE